MNSELQIVSNYCNLNKLSINMRKTNFMIITSPQKPTIHNINILNIERKTSIKDLGIYLNEHLNCHLAFVISRLDYCNSLLFGLPDYVINRLQLIQNSAARLVFCACKHDHVTPLMVNLHWLPVQSRIQFKILLMTFKVLRGEAPSYL